MRQVRTTELPSQRWLGALRHPRNCRALCRVTAKHGPGDLHGVSSSRRPSGCRPRSTGCSSCTFPAPGWRFCLRQRGSRQHHVPHSGKIALGSPRPRLRRNRRAVHHPYAGHGINLGTKAFGVCGGNGIPRLTTTLIMWFIYVSYLAMRSYIDEPDVRERMASVLGVVGVVSVPIVWFSVEWWRSLHPTPSITNPGGGMPREMLTDPAGLGGSVHRLLRGAGAAAHSA